MFFKRSSVAQDIEKSVLENLPPPQSEEDGFQVALQSLANSADLFEALDLPEEAEVITQFMETIASGQFAMVKEAKKKAKKKKKSKVKKKPTKKTNRFSKDLSPENQVKNMAEVGWVFNSPCMDCDDENMADDVLDDEVFEAELVGSPFPGHLLEGETPDMSKEEKVRLREHGKKPRELPVDYERCDGCGYDHIYEPEEAWKGHYPEKNEEEFDGQEDLERQFPQHTIDVNNAKDKDKEWQGVYDRADKRLLDINNKREPLVGNNLTRSDMIEAAKQLCEEYGYEVIQKSHDKILLRRKRDGLKRLEVVIPSDGRFPSYKTQ